MSDSAWVAESETAQGRARCSRSMRAFTNDTSAKNKAPTPRTAAMANAANCEKILSPSVLMLQITGLEPALYPRDWPPTKPSRT